MERQKANMLATVLGIIGTLLMLVMAFGLFFENRMLPLFLGIACFIVAGALKKGAAR